MTNAAVLPAERCRIEHAAGRVLRGEIRADRDFPPFDRVMMDGYALRSSDLATGRSFQIAGSAPAGKAAYVLPESPGCCVEVMTGAPLPYGADCIVPVEDVSIGQSGEVEVAPSFEFFPGKFIHRAGSDTAAGEILLRPGFLLGSREIGIAASCGAAWLEASCLPVISVFATGDELVAVDQVPSAHQIRQSNAHAIRCALQRAGHEVAHCGTLGDDAPRSEGALRLQLESSDWLILTGAVSKGARDFIPATLAKLGCRQLFHGVAQRPGKPAGCWIGPAGQMIVALPGNPVSALVGLHALVLPALAAASGRTPAKARLVVPGRGIEGLETMTLHLPVTIGDDGRACATATSNSGDFTGLLRSEGFITLPPRGGVSSAVPFTPWL